MTEAKDTVIKTREWLDALGIDRAYRKDMKESYRKDVPALEAQAEISFKAGRRDVAGWGSEICSDVTHRNLGQHIPRRLCSVCWQSILKEWG